VVLQRQPHAGGRLDDALGHPDGVSRPGAGEQPDARGVDVEREAAVLPGERRGEDGVARGGHDRRPGDRGAVRVQGAGERAHSCGR
jgi:hypothetical protein